MYNVAILTVSDRGARGEREDAGGPAIMMAIEADNRFRVVATGMVPDEVDEIGAFLLRWCDDHIPLILTTGGTGMSPRDVTPEATAAVIERPAPGFAEAMRQESRAITPHAMLSRAVAGIRGQSLIVNLPGSVKAAKECLAVILPALPHALDKLAGDPSECGRS
ncbi:MAG: MogA/MoaB family molybdenum cofactor biosynthesis protein [Deltaproteobacteria bacterium]|nr:MogA/MoaB family molybdenum cofactor biosynthesis protein [Candidatus Anaeroferrophillacea bacterium]